MITADLYCTGFWTKFGLTTLQSLQYRFVSCTGKSQGLSEHTVTSLYSLLPAFGIFFLAVKMFVSPCITESVHLYWWWWRTSCSSNYILNVKYIKSKASNWDTTCHQVAEDVSSWMVAILLHTDVFHLLDGPWIHVSTMQESVHRKD